MQEEKEDEVRMKDHNKRGEGKDFRSPYRDSTVGEGRESEGEEGKKRRLKGWGEEGQGNQGNCS